MLRFESCHDALGKEAIALVVVLVGRIARLDHLVKVGQAVWIIVEFCVSSDHSDARRRARKQFRFHDESRKTEEEKIIGTILYLRHIFGQRAPCGHLSACRTLARLAAAQLAKRAVMLIMLDGMRRASLAPAASCRLAAAISDWTESHINVVCGASPNSSAMRSVAHIAASLRRTPAV